MAGGAGRDAAHGIAVVDQPQRRGIDREPCCACPCPVPCRRRERRIVRSQIAEIAIAQSGHIAAHHGRIAPPALEVLQLFVGRGPALAPQDSGRCVVAHARQSVAAVAGCCSQRGAPAWIRARERLLRGSGPGDVRWRLGAPRPPRRASRRGPPIAPQIASQQAGPVALGLYRRQPGESTLPWRRPAAPRSFRSDREPAVPRGGREPVVITPVGNAATHCRPPPRACAIERRP